MKRLIVEIGVWVLSVRRIEPEWATGTVWIDGHWVASATPSAPSGATPVGCGWRFQHHRPSANRSGKSLGAASYGFSLSLVERPRIVGATGGSPSFLPYVA